MLDIKLDVRFEVAKFNDVEEIINLCNECFNESTDLEYAKNSFLLTQNNENDVYLKGTVDGKIIAHAKITIIHTMYEQMGTYAILNHVCVKPEYRRSGVATKMLDEITKICLTKGVKTLELWSNNVRVAAHACYKNYGFHLDDAGFFSKTIG